MRCLDLSGARTGREWIGFDQKGGQGLNRFDLVGFSRISPEIGEGFYRRGAKDAEDKEKGGRAGRRTIPVKFLHSLRPRRLCGYSFLSRIQLNLPGGGVGGVERRGGDFEEGD